MWWQDVLWGFWNGITAWPVLIVHVFGAWDEFPSTTSRGPATGTTSASSSAQADRSSVPARGDAAHETAEPPRTAGAHAAGWLEAPSWTSVVWA